MPSPHGPLGASAEFLLRELAENASDAIYAHDLEGRLIWVNRAAETLTGRSRAELLGTPIVDLVPPESRERVAVLIERLLAGEQDAATHSLEIAAGDGRRRSVEVSIRRLVRDGRVVGGQGVARDVTVRLRAERQQRFLAEASRILASSLDYETTLRTVARLAIPEMADWCAVDLVGPDATTRPVARAHVDPAREADLQTLYRRYPPTLQGDRPAAYVLRTGRPLFLPDAEATRVETSLDPEHAALRRAIGFDSLLAVPLLVGGRTLGSMVFVTGPGRPRYRPDDLPIAEELGRRAAVAIDNARSYRDAEERAEAHVALGAALRESADALRESEERYRRLVEGAPDAIAVHRDGKILYANPAAASLIGAPDAGALVGRSIMEFVHPDDRALVAARASQVVVEGRPAATVEERFVRLDGRIVDVEVVSLPMTFAGERAAQIVARDVTALKRAADRAGRLQTVATALAGASTALQVARIVVEQASLALGARACALLRLVEAGDWLEVLHQTGYAAETPAAVQVMAEYRRFPLSIATPAADAVRTGAVVALEGSQARAARYPHLAGVQSLVGEGAALAVPLMAEGRPLGALYLNFSTERDFSDADRSFLATMAAQCAVALERTRLFEVEREARAAAEVARARMALLAEASRLFAAAGPDSQAVLDLLLERAATVVGEAGIIRLLREDGSCLDLAAVRHPDPDAAAMLRSRPLSDPTPVGVGATGQAVASGRPVLAERIEPGAVPAGAGPFHGQYLARFPVRSAVAVPMRARDRVVGVLAMSRARSDRPYSGDEVDLLQDLADRGALAVENARLIAASSRAAARMERLQTITAELGRSLTPETVLQQVTDAAALLLEAPIAAVFLLGQPDGDFVLAAVRGIEAERAGRLRLPRRTSLAGRAIDAGRTLMVNDVRTDPGTALPALLGATDGAEIAAPFRGAQGTLGVVKVFSPTARRFTAEDADLLEALAAAAAVAIGNARLYRAAQESVRARDSFLSIAAHELKTPTTAVLAGAQLLARRSAAGRLVAESVERYAGVIAESAKRLGRLVDDLLDVSRARTGQLALRLVPTDLGELAGRVAARYRDQVESTHELVTDLAPGGCFVRADPDRLEQVIENLLDNAVKYSPEGGRIELAVERLDGEIRLQVCDQGIGLPPDAAERIFEPFERAPNAMTRQLPGMGLGLHICRNIVELHGGRVEARSPGENLGTTVSVWLPRADGEDV